MLLVENITFISGCDKQYRRQVSLFIYFWRCGK